MYQWLWCYPAECDLGVYLLDSQLTMKQHVDAIATSRFYRLRRLRQVVRHSVGHELAAQIAYAFVTSRLDYCNAIVSGL